MKKYNILNLTFFCFFLFSCSEGKRITSKDVIISSELITFENLSSEEKEWMKYGVKCHINSWINGNKIDLENAYYVKATINNDYLAELSTKELKDKYRLLKDDNVRLLYGKYKNRFVFLDSLSNKICETDKHLGYEILSVVRSQSNDTIVIGPLNMKPYKMKILPNHSKFKPEVIITF